MRSLIYKKDIKELLNDYEIIGRGKTSICLTSDNPNFIILATVDDIKLELLENFGLIKEYLNDKYKNTIEKYNNNNYFELNIVKIKRLKKIKEIKDKKIRKKIKEFKNDLYSLKYAKYKFYEIINNLMEKYKHEKYIYIFLDFFRCFDPDYFILDIHNGNILLDSNYNIIPYDLLLDKELYNKIKN